MNDPAYNPEQISEVDQLGAATRDLLNGLNLRLVASSSPDETWLAHLSGEELWDVMLTNSANIVEAGNIWALIAIRTPGGDIAAHLCEIGPAES